MNSNILKYYVFNELNNKNYYVVLQNKRDVIIDENYIMYRKYWNSELITLVKEGDLSAIKWLYYNKYGNSVSELLKNPKTIISNQYLIQTLNFPQEKIRLDNIYYEELYLGMSNHKKVYKWIYANANANSIHNIHHIIIGLLTAACQNRNICGLEELSIIKWLFKKIDVSQRYEYVSYVYITAIKNDRQDIIEWLTINQINRYFRNIQSNVSNIDLCCECDSINCIKYFPK